MKCFLTIIVLALCNMSIRAELKPRVVILTDIGRPDLEPDDTESLVHLLCYADLLEIEGIITSTGWNCDPYPVESAAYRDSVIEAYGKDVEKLMARSGQKDFLPLDLENRKQSINYWPSVEYLRSRCVMGSRRAGIGVIGQDNDTPGSNLIIRLTEEDDERPLWICAWGGVNTLAQAVWRIKQNHTPEELKSILKKLRLYTITDQDMVYSMRNNLAYSSHQWMRQEFKDDLLFVWDEGTWQQQCSIGQKYWPTIQEFIQGHAALGKHYPDYKYGVEGDTPSFLNVIPNGLNNPEDPMQAGWGGYHSYGISKDSITYAWSSWQEPAKSISVNYYKQFFPDQLNDFAARIEWAEKGCGNINPTVIINGKTGFDAIHIKAKCGESVTLDASQSFDCDNDSINFKWWQQKGIGNINVNIKNDTANRITVDIPYCSASAHDTVHIICEVHDNGPHKLVAYRRIIISI